LAEETGGALNFLTENFKRAGSDIASAGLGIAGNLLSGSQSLSAYSDALNSNTKILGTASKAIAGLVNFAEGSLKEYQQLTNIGATFGASVVDIKQSAAEMGLEVKEMTEFFMKNQNALRVLGGTTEDATQSFVQMSKDFLDSDFGTNLRMLGYDVQDINESLATFADLQTVEGMRRMRTDGTLNSNAAQFATTLDELSKLTGKQRDQIAEEMRQRRRNGQVQALLSTLSEDSAMALQEGLQTAGELGPGFETLIQDLVAFGAPVSDASKEIAKALPSVIDEYEAYAQAIRNGASAEEAQGLLDEAIGASVEGMESPEFANLALLGNFSDVGANAADMLESSFDLRRGITSAAEGSNDLAAVIGSLRDTIADQQQAQIGAGGIIRQTVDMQEALRETVMYVQQTALPALVGAAETALTKVTEAMGDDAALRRQVEEAISKVLNPAADAIDRLNEGFSFTPNTVDMDAEEVILGEGTAADLANQLEMDIDNVLNENEISTRTDIEEHVNTARSELADAQQELARLHEQQGQMTADGFTAQDAASRYISEQIANAEAKVEATKRVVESLTHMQRVPGSIRGFDSGGRIPLGEMGLVGEFGPEIISGGASITGRMKTFDVMNKIAERMNSVATLQENQVDNSNAISNNNNSELGNMIKNLNDAIRDLNVGIYNVASINEQQLQTELKNLRATKGLNGNILKGVAR